MTPCQASLGAGGGGAGLVWFLPFLNTKVIVKSSVLNFLVFIQKCVVVVPKLIKCLIYNVREDSKFILYHVDALHHFLSSSFHYDLVDTAFQAYTGFPWTKHSLRCSVTAEGFFSSCKALSLSFSSVLALPSLSSALLAFSSQCALLPGVDFQETIRVSFKASLLSCEVLYSPATLCLDSQWAPVSSVKDFLSNRCILCPSFGFLLYKCWALCLAEHPVLHLYLRFF